MGAQTAEMTTIYLLRHGEPDYEPVRERRWPGSMADLAPLSAQGVEQATEAARHLAGVGAVRLVSSPFTRTMQTASIVACHVGLLIEVEFDLHEWLPDNTFGWQDHDEVRVFLADFENSGGEWPADQQRPWEPLSAVRQRAASALRRAAASVDGGGAVIAVTHEMVIRAVTGETMTWKGRFREIDSSELP
jgi:broad specificity phosphatase PhoE